MTVIKPESYEMVNLLYQIIQHIQVRVIWNDRLRVNIAIASGGIIRDSQAEDLETGN